MLKIVVLVSVAKKKFALLQYFLSLGQGRALAKWASKNQRPVPALHERSGQRCFMQPDPSLPGVGVVPTKVFLWCTSSSGEAKNERKSCVEGQLMHCES